MSSLRNLGRASDPRRRPWGPRLLLGVGILIVGSVAVITAAYYFDVATESNEFCGLLCHPNRPEYVSHEVSAHANVECGTCHIGPGLLPKVQAKIYGVGELVSLVTNTYGRPIEPPVARMPPADVACQQCHWPASFNAQELLQTSTFAADEQNAETSTDLTLKISATDPPGSQGGELQQGAHWHVDNPVWYVARDENYQDIPWVASVGAEGQGVVYQAQDNPLTEQELSSLPIRRMDCIDCHNRPTHQFRNPADLVDEAIAAGEIDRSLPYVKREAIELLSTSYPTQEAGVQAMQGLADFYRSGYPDLYASQQGNIDQVVKTLQTIYSETTFPDMNLTWQSYPDNLGHQDFPGCFRCHDAQHVNAQQEPIPNNCTLCHSVPVATGPGQTASVGSIVNAVVQTRAEPASHLQPDFMFQHRILANDSCADCHGPIQYGTDNTSFCANGICHGQEWPQTAAAASFVHPVALVGQHAEATCNQCHQGRQELSIEDCATCHQPPSEPHFGSDCSQCHTPTGWRESAVSWVTNVPPITHRVGGTLDCLSCHSEGGAVPVPASHQGIPSASCVSCHQSGAILETPTIPHKVEAADTCQTCHGEGQLKPTSAFHEQVPADSCLYCHESVPLQDVPAIPHTLEGHGLCLVCHDKGQIDPVPDSHDRWTNESCLLCHEPTTAQ
jgi:hypothetical protein